MRSGDEIRMDSPSTSTVVSLTVRFYQPGSGFGVDLEPGKEELDEGSDRQGEENSPDADCPAEQPATDKGGAFDARASESQGRAPAGDACHETVTGTGTEVDAYVEPAANAYENDAR